MSHSSLALGGASDQPRTKNRHLADQRVGRSSEPSTDSEHDRPSMSQPGITDLEIILRPFLL